MYAKVADNWCKNWYRKLMKGSVEMDVGKCKKGFKSYVARPEEKADKYDKLQARLETAERLVLQGGAGHDAIVEKAVELQKQKTAAELTVKTLKFVNGDFAKENKKLQKQRDALLKACKAALDFLDTSSKLDWDNILTPKLEKAISLCEK